MFALRIQILRLLFAVVLVLPVLIPAPAQAVEDCAAVSGAWFDPALDGEGFYLLETGSGLAITYYGSINTEQRLWLVSEVLPGPITFGMDLSVDMLVGDGGNFQQPLPSSELTLWGNLTMNFSDSGRARFLLSGTDGDKQSEVVKIAGVRRQVCNAAHCVIPTEGSSRLSFANDAVHGIFDPSLDAKADTGEVWLSYSSVSASLQWSPQNPVVVQTRLARSTDAGLTFSFVNEINPVLDVTLDLAPPNNAGTWINEVSSLAYDMTAAPEQRWKLIWHHYLQIDGVSYFEHGWLGYRSAAQPDQLKDATEFKLFGGGIYDPVNNSTDGITQSPVGGAPLIDIRDLSQELASCSVLSEPGWMSNTDALYLSVGCFQVEPRENRIVLLACAQPCKVTDPQAWRFVKTLLVDSDAQALGYKQFSAPDLFSTHGETYLWVSPVSDSPFPDSYLGCRAYRFTNLADGSLQTNAEGQPTPALALDGLPESFNGACALHAAAGDQSFYSQLMTSSSEKFQVFRASSDHCLPQYNKN